MLLLCCGLTLCVDIFIFLFAFWSASHVSLSKPSVFVTEESISPMIAVYFLARFRDLLLFQNDRIVYPTTVLRWEIERAIEKYLDKKKFRQRQWCLTYSRLKSCWDCCKIFQAQDYTQVGLANNVVVATRCKRAVPGFLVRVKSVRADQFYRGNFGPADQIYR